MEKNTTHEILKSIYPKHKTVFEMPRESPHYNRLHELHGDDKTALAKALAIEESRWLSAEKHERYTTFDNAGNIILIANPIAWESYLGANKMIVRIRPIPEIIMKAQDVKKERPQGEGKRFKQQYPDY